MLEHDTETAGWLTCDHVEWCDGADNTLACADCGMDVSFYLFPFVDEWLSGSCADGAHARCPERANDGAPCSCECHRSVRHDVATL
jgi:hypothetical protein